VTFLVQRQLSRITGLLAHENTKNDTSMQKDVEPAGRLGYYDIMVGNLNLPYGQQFNAAIMKRKKR
jgi:hypothetical protein